MIKKDAKLPKLIKLLSPGHIEATELCENGHDLLERG